MYLNNGLKVKIRGIHIGLLVLLAAFFVRIYGYLFGTPNRFILEVTLMCVGVFALLSAIKLARLKNCAYNSLLNVATLFWIWTCISSLVNIRDISGLIYDLVMQSLWFLFFMFFTYYSGYALPKDMEFVKKSSAAFMVGMGLVYVLWLFFGGDTLVSGALNTVYYCLLLLPVVFVLRNKLVMILSTVTVFLAVIVSGKRTAFIALMLALFIPMLFFGGKRKHRLRRIVLMLLLVAALFVAYYFITSVFEITLFDRLQELSDDAGSGRLEIYEMVIDGFKQSSPMEKIFGHGFNGVAYDKAVLRVSALTNTVVATSAHNDFLEVLYDYGIVGFALYIFMLARMIKIAFRLRKRDGDVFRMYLSALIMFFVMSVFSHLIIYPTYVAFLLIFISWGSLVAMRREGENEDSAR